MSLRRKTRLISLLLAAFALWPLAHHLVVTRHFVNPWRLFGWAMYCVPIYRPQVQFFIERNGERLEIAFPRDTADNARAYEQYTRLRSELGTLVSPDELGHILFDRYPELDRVVIKITQPVYHYDSDRIRQAYFEHTLERLPPAGSP